MKRLLSLITFVILSISCIYAQKKVLVITPKNGDEIRIGFDKEPVAYMEYEGVRIVSTDIEVSFSFDEIDTFTFADEADQGQSLEQVEEEKTGSTQIFTIQGKLVETVDTLNSPLQLSHLHPGTYIIRNGSNSYKVMIK